MVEIMPIGIIKDYFYIAAIVVLMVLSGYFFVDSWSKDSIISRQESSITTLSVQKEALEKSNQDLTKAIDNQNNAVAALESIQAGIDVAMSQFNSTVETTKRDIQAIKQNVKKEALPQTCEQAIQYLRDVPKGLKQ